jgi:hypothetical protein
MATYAKALTLLQYRALLSGLARNCPGATFTIRGVTYTVPQLEAMITGVIDAEVAVPAAKAAWQEAIIAASKLEATDGKTIRAVRDIVTVMFETQATVLADMGIDPPKERAPLSVEARLAAAEKLRATRAARGTKSKKQKSKIKGNVTGVTITPVVAGEPEEVP